MKAWRKRMASAAIWAAALGTGYFGYSHFQDNQFARAEEKREEVRKGLSHAEDLASAFRDVGKVVEPAVVNINVKKKAPGMSRRLNEDMLKRLFPDQDGDGEPDVPEGLVPRQSPGNDDEDLFAMGTGSGVIMEASDGKGYILTNNHVAGGAEEMLITLADGREIKNGKLLGADAKTDLAVVEVKADHLSAAKWGNSDELQKGDWIMAFGSPFGYVGSMTHGIVSALNRQAGILGTGGYENFIQVDAPINPGNSGGPLVSLRGEVVGINTAIASRSGGFQGIGFAIPSNQAKQIYQQLKEKGKVTRGWLGVGIRDVSAQLPLAHSFGYEGDQGVLVEQVIPGTPATGKLHNGDIITEVNGKKVKDVQQLRSAVATMPPGEQVEMTLYRHGKNDKVTVKLGEQPEDLATARNGRERPNRTDSTPDAIGAEQLGIRVQTLTSDVAERSGLDLKSGVVITRVDRGSLAAKELLRVGDVITEVGETPVKTAEDFTAAMKNQDVKKGVRLYVTSREGSRFVFLSSEK